jgi:hypothetical protein
MTKEEILTGLGQTTDAFIEFTGKVSPAVFFRQPPEKWSIAQNVIHLVSSANATRLAYSLPKFILRWYAGKPNRPSRSYEELVAKYKSKLEQGGRAGGRFVPAKAAISPTTDSILRKFSLSMHRLGDVLQKKWTEEQLDRYIAPHPLLGKITLRELAYFTIYHVQHHQRIIGERLQD